jgi:hypothetical protein
VVVLHGRGPLNTWLLHGRDEIATACGTDKGSVRSAGGAAQRYRQLGRLRPRGYEGGAGTSRDLFAKLKRLSKLEGEEVHE